jgi:predicted enzyme related to lactoylglutathione lyase
MFDVIHFEIPADDVGRAQKFYGDLFGWKIEKFTGPTPMEYWGITTSTAKAEMGLQNGGLMARQAPSSRSPFMLTCPPWTNTWTRY